MTVPSATPSVAIPPGAQALMERFAARQGRVAVVGLGYVGLPLAVILAEAGCPVVGIDSDPAKVGAISQGESYIEDVPGEKIRALVERGLLSATATSEAVSQVDGVSICVPTPLRKTGDPDLSFIVSAVRSIVPYLHKEMVVILESTSYPGTTREMLLPEISNAGLKVGEDFFLAFSPERVDPGREDWTTANMPKIVGGITPACTEVAAGMYAQAIETIVRVSSAEVAEMAKLLENTFRAVNIGLVNEMALMCERLGIDVWEVIEAASSKPFGFMKFTPGPGLGGHCIPIDPLYLSWKLKSVQYNARFIDLASEINTSMPRHVVRRVQDLLNTQGKALQGSKILVLGVAYKPDVSDVRESPAIDVIGLLQEKGAEVGYHDPHVASLKHEGLQLQSIPDMEQAAANADCVIIVTDHQLIDYAALANRAHLIFDTRNAMARHGVYSPKVAKL